ncbi:hypothetical protein O7608_13940 [Solwaraspora sp. WMMA2056]|uniref:hypothetical protein n=1 Tax=Solwaraspora sp. WMMA2056 TaxID=3015161 RepID=UPI00259B8034|nr:hypothetical protein [Solwaraspora sp. WMMA2056]WJK43400.1 hypothetical protein O7608_13940 [Solwaraspora sp. WMMA2056]
MVDQGWTARTSRLVHITEVPTPMRYAVEEHCAGQLMGELAGASACCLTAITEPGGSTGTVRHRLDILLGRHLLSAGDGPHRGYARSARLTAVTLAAPTPYGVLITARWQAHGRAESCWLGFGDSPDGRTFLLLLRTAVERASGQVPAGACGRSAHRTGRFSRVR